MSVSVRLIVHRLEKEADAIMSIHEIPGRLLRVEEQFDTIW